MAGTDPIVPRLAVVLGIALVLVGVGGYVISEFASVTALIPAAFGVLIVVLGAVARDPDRRRLGTYGVAVLSLLGVLGSLRGVPDIVSLVTGESVDSTIAATSQGAMILLCLALLAGVVYDLRLAE